eukprot:8897285-Pyramimonas_sp.AAC.2
MVACCDGKTFGVGTKISFIHKFGCRIPSKNKIKTDSVSYLERCDGLHATGRSFLHTGPDPTDVLPIVQNRPQVAGGESTSRGYRRSFAIIVKRKSSTSHAARSNASNMVWHPNVRTRSGC